MRITPELQAGLAAWGPLKIPDSDALAAALRRLHAGDADGALSLLEKVPDGPTRPSGWHAVRGMALLAQANWAEARATLRTAITLGDRSRGTALNYALARIRVEGTGTGHVLSELEREHPQWDEPPFRLAEALRADGKPEAAAAAYERALAVAPGRTEALLRLATLHIGCGAARRAKSLLIRCCGVAPGNWEAWDALGLTCSLLAEREEARQAFRRAASLNPGSISVALRLAGAAAALGEAELELPRFQAVSTQDPLNVAALAARGALHAELGHDEAALELLEAAVAIDPEGAELAALRAERLLRGNRHGDAAEALRQAAALAPDNPALRNNLAVALTRTHHYAEAIQVLDELAQVQGERTDMLCNRANALVCLGRQAEGVATARRAIELAADTPSHRHLAWRTFASALAYSSDVGGRSLAHALQKVSETAPRQAGDDAARSEFAPIRAEAGGRRKIRVGLLSATLKTHPVGWLTVAAFENLDVNRFEIVCIAQRMGTDPMQRRFRAAAAEWHAVAEAGPTAVVAKARDLQLDILIDLGGYGDQGMLGLCARRLAPVQIKWVGMQNHTTSMPEIDWFITDKWETPAHLAGFYSERLLIMPDGYACYSPPVHAPDCAPLPAQRIGAVTFGCFNNLAKITPDVVTLWSEILHEISTSRLILKTHQLADPSTAAFVRESFESHGIASERLVLRGGSRHPDLLAEYGDVDIVLDPFPYSGGLTTCEALWMGVPVLTWPGETFASRHSASHLHNVGLGDWVVADRNAYRDEAIQRSGDLDGLATVRSSLRERMRASPLCDAPRFGRHLGDALLRIWNERASGIVGDE